MIIEQSKIINIIDNKMILLASKQSACGKCGGCGFANLEKVGKSKTITLTTKLIDNAKIGDKAVIAIDETKLLKLAFRTYVIPLLILIIATITTTQFNLHDLIKAVIILSITFIALISVNYYNNQTLKKHINFKVVKIIPQ